MNDTNIGIPTSDEIKEDNATKRTRGKRLIVIVIIIVVSWLIVKIWADVFDVFMHNVIKVPRDKFVPNLIGALIFTFIVVSLLYICEMDDLISA